jgi:hypothetical protein
MHSPKPFSSTVLIELDSHSPYGSGIRDSFIPWETWLMTPEATLKLVMESQIYSVASTIPNKILCAAVWHLTFDANISRPLNVEFGTVFTGRRHSNCYEQMMAFGVQIQQDCVDGFLTENNVFLTREQAMLVASVNNQLLPHCKGMAPTLISEMLYED